MTDTGAGKAGKAAAREGRTGSGSLRSWEGPRPAGEKASLRDARRHSLRVRRMRVVLPVAAVVILAVVFGYASLYRADNRLTLSYGEITQEEGLVRMTEPRFSVRDSAGRPATVSAREARQVRGSFNRYELEGLQADLTMPDGGRLSILAPQGLLDREAATLHLTGGLSLYTDSGYELLAERATVHFEESRALAEGDIRGLGPFGDITSDRLVITENGQRVRFEGNVRAALAAEGSDPALSPVPRPPLADEPATGGAAGATGDG